MKKFIGFILALLFISSCSSNETTWTELFRDDFDPTFREGVNFYYDPGTTFNANSTGATCIGSGCGAEYEAPNDILSTDKAKMTIWFMLSEQLGENDYIVLLDVNDTGNECDHGAGIMNIGGTDTLIIYDNSESANSGTFLASIALDNSLEFDTGYNIEFYGVSGTLTAKLKLGNTDTVIKEVSGTSNNDACNYGEMGFVASDDDNSGLEIQMRHFTVYTGE